MYPSARSRAAAASASGVAAIVEAGGAYGGGRLRTTTRAAIDAGSSAVITWPGISDETREYLIKLFSEMHKTKGWQAELKRNGWIDAFITGDEFGTFLKEQDERVATTLKELGLA